MASLHALWTFTAGASSQAGAPAPRFDASPTVVGGRVYIGSRTGIVYALNETTGAVVWQKQLDFGSSTVCGAKGITGTATVAADPVSGTMTVYVPGAHYLYALNASTGAQAVEGRDRAGHRRRRSALVQLVVADGRRRAASTWAWPRTATRTRCAAASSRSTSTPASAAHLVRGPGRRGRPQRVEQHGRRRHQRVGDHREPGPERAGRSTTRSRSSGCRRARWSSRRSGRRPPRWPTTSTSAARRRSSRATIGGTATDLIGACNKNGIYYVWRRTNLAAGPVWQRQVGQSGGTGNGACITSAAFDGPGSTLYVAANQTMLNGSLVQGSMLRVEPGHRRDPLAVPAGLPPERVADAQRDDATCWPSRSTSAPPGVAGRRAVQRADGAPLRTLTTAKPVFAQPVFANGKLFVADESGVLQAYAP